MGSLPRSSIHRPQDEVPDPHDLPLLCVASTLTEEDRGFLGDLWGSITGNGDQTQNQGPIETLIGLLESSNTGETTDSSADTTESADTTTETGMATTTSDGSTSSAISAITDVLTGVTNVLNVEAVGTWLGLGVPVPSPFKDPIGFLKHPLISKIIIAKLMLNPKLLALALGKLAGYMVLSQIFGFPDIFADTTTGGVSITTVWIKLQYIGHSKLTNFIQ